MTTHEQGLLQAVLDAPDADEPRLIYADWLEEHGQPERAEFIRVQCSIARICAGNRSQQPEPDAEKLAQLSKRQGKLFHGVWELGWCAPVPLEWLSDSLIRRGFVELVTCSCVDWRAHGPAIVRQQPVQEVRTERVPHEFGERWCWYRFEFRYLAKHEEKLPGFRNWIPLEIAGLLQADQFTDGHFIYQHRAAAEADLSRALLAWARKTGGDAAAK